MHYCVFAVSTEQRFIVPDLRGWNQSGRAEIMWRTLLSARNKHCALHCNLQGDTVSTWSVLAVNSCRLIQDSCFNSLRPCYPKSTRVLASDNPCADLRSQTAWSIFNKKLAKIAGFKPTAVSGSQSAQVFIGFCRNKVGVLPAALSGRFAVFAVCKVQGIKSLKDTQESWTVLYLFYDITEIYIYCMFIFWLCFSWYTLL